MKESIFGFSQSKIISNGLTSDDLIIISYFMDKQQTIEAQELAEEFPFMQVQQRTICIKLNYLLKKGILTKIVKLEAEEKKVYYALSNYASTLLYNENETAAEEEKPKEVEIKIIKSPTTPSVVQGNIEEIKEILDYLNLRTSSRYTTRNKRNVSFINARMKESYKVEDFKKVIDIKTEEWLGTDMEKFLRPETLFGNKFESYLNQKQTKHLFKNTGYAYKGKESEGAF